MIKISVHFCTLKETPVIFFYGDQSLNCHFYPVICLIKCDKLVHKNICATKLYFPSNELNFLEISMMKLEFYLESRK